MPATDHDQRARDLHRRLQELIDGNGVAGADLKLCSYQGADHRVDASVAWTFTYERASETLPGDHAVRSQGTHHGYDRASLMEQVETLCREAAQSPKLRAEFTERVTREGSAALAWSGQTQTLGDFGRHSVHRECPDCGGGKIVRCSRCNGSGRGTCFSCSGTGRVSQSTWERYSDGRSLPSSRRVVCSSCSGTGKIRCHACRGDGQVTCPDCEGHGFFTDILHVTAVVEPTWHVSVEPGVASREALKFLERAGASGSAQQIELEPDGADFDEAGQWVARYRGVASVVELVCELRSQRYTFPALGRRLLPLVRPPMFDQIFAPVSAEVAAGTPEGRTHLTGSGARRVFATARSMTALDRVLQALAVSPLESENANAELARKLILGEAEGFISGEPVFLLGDGLPAALQHVSPTHSPWAWRLVMALPVLSALALAELGVERAVDAFAACRVALGVVGVGSAVVLALSPVAASLSALICQLRRRGLPEVYWRRPRNWAPHTAMYPWLLAAALLGSSYGAAARDRSLPRLEWHAAHAARETAIWLEEHDEIRWLGVPLIRSGQWLSARLEALERTAEEL